MATDENHTERVFSVKLWPPSENTRLMLVERMTSTLSSESYFSRKYGLLSKEEAAEDAKRIEDIAFVAANDHASRHPDADGRSTVQLYAQEASKLMLEALKRGPSTDKIANPVAREAFPELVEVKETAEVKETDELKETAEVKETDELKETVEVKETVFDISGGSRGFVDKDLATELLRPLEEPGNSYTKICFSNRSFGLDAAYVAQRVLMGVQKNLTDVDLADFVAGRPEAEALEVMSIFSSVLEGCVLRSLNLSHNALGEKGIRAFGSLLKSQKTLEELYFMNNGISGDAARAICELLPSVEKIKTLHFHNNMTGDDGADALSELVTKCIALEDFRCSSTRIGTQGGISLAGALGKGNSLKKLDLMDNMFGKRGGVAVSRAISGHLGLTEVYLSYLNFEDKGAIAIANSLKDAAPSLRVLEIAGNEITPKAAPAFAECLAVKSLLTKFVASENELKDEGSVIICKALLEGHDHLKELDLSTNGITGIGAKAAAETVANKTDFNLLNIDGNFISEEGIETVKDVLRKGTKGVSVLGSLEDNNEEGEGDEENEGENENGDEEESSDNDTLLEEKLQNLKV
ncbi:RAN GTPase-activating protein 1 [Cryptomeria japonica]|uniref:RAN GTPase-activating protein 1 n=1 Tax=Cryptomeria japonica TaxID=3369 RepID=UPI0027DA95A1|nr:RAN GTPase-activating protein 1 [Cryptomeria japonica]